MVSIRRTKEDLLNQYEFIHKLTFGTYYKRLIRISLSVTLAFTLVTFVCWMLLNSGPLIGLNGILFIMSMLSWATLVFIIAWYSGKKYKAQKWVKATVEGSIADKTNYSVQFDDDKIAFLTDNYKAEFNWSFFSSFAETRDCIYFFQPNRSYYECTCFSEYELGAANIERLKQIARERLPLVKLNGT